MSRPDEIMPANEFKYGLLKLVDKNDKFFISETVIARHLAATYIDADEDAQRDCSNMLREDLAELERCRGSAAGGKTTSGKPDSKNPAPIIE